MQVCPPPVYKMHFKLNFPKHLWTAERFQLLFVFWRCYAFWKTPTELNAYAIQQILFDAEVLLRKTKGFSEVLEKSAH